MKLPEIDPRDADGIKFELGEGSWKATDEEGDVRAELPHWLTRDQAAEIFCYITAHASAVSGNSYRDGRQSERERIAYGFKILLEPLCDAMKHAAEIANPNS